MSDVTVGVDPHKKSVTIEAIDDQEKKLATGRFGTGTRDYKAMLGYVPPAVAAPPVGHRGRPRCGPAAGTAAARRRRVGGRRPGQARGTGPGVRHRQRPQDRPVDAHAIAAAALRTPKLRMLSFDEELVALRLLVNRRDELSARRVQTVNRLHRLLTELQDSASPVRPTSSSLTLTSERAPAISSPHRSADFSTLVDPYLTLKGEIRRAQP